MEERETLKHQAQKRGAAVIVDQIKEREIERIKEQELREKEMAQMQKQVEVMREQERQAAEVKKERSAVMVKEVEEANKIALSAKAKRVNSERSEDMKIFRYNQERALKEEDRLAEERRVKAQKEFEVQKLRELQEKAQDRQAEIDALRAKRAFEEGERYSRAKELSAIELKKRQMSDLEYARKKQFMERELNMAEQAKTERDAFLKVIEEQRRTEANEREIADEKNNALRSHAQCIREQIQQNSEKKKQDRLDFLEEGKKIRQRLEDERSKVEGIKQRKMGELNELGISDKYKAELAKKKIT